jgi:hypothetical protein
VTGAGLSLTRRKFGGGVGETRLSRASMVCARDPPRGGKCVGPRPFDAFLSALPRATAPWSDREKARKTQPSSFPKQRDTQKVDRHYHKRPP